MLDLDFFENGIDLEGSIDSQLQVDVPLLQLANDFLGALDTTLLMLLNVLSIESPLRRDRVDEFQESSLLRGLALALGTAVCFPNIDRRSV